MGANLSSACTAAWSYYAVESEADKIVDVGHAVGGIVSYLFKICYPFFAAFGVDSYLPALEEGLWRQIVAYIL